MTAISALRSKTLWTRTATLTEAREATRRFIHSRSNHQSCIEQRQNYLQARLKDIVWGRRQEVGAQFPYSSTVDGPLKMELQEFMSIPRNEAVKLVDFCLPPFLNTTSVTSAAPSQASEGIPQSETLQAIRRDRTWIEDLVSWTRNRLGDDPVKASSEKARGHLMSALYAGTCKDDSPVKAYGKLIGYVRSEPQIEYADAFLRCALNDDKARSLFNSALQKPISVSGGNIVRPDVTMKLKTDEAIAWFEEKSIPVQFYHAVELERTTSAVYKSMRSSAIRDIYKQAYAPTQSDDGSLCNIVRMGNDALYRWGYVTDHSLVVSDWRSIDKPLAETILKEVYPNTQFKVTQGYPVLENIAIYLLTTELGVDRWLADRKSRWDPLRITSQVMAVLNTMVDFCNDAWTTLPNIFRGKMPRSLTLGKVLLTGLLSSYDKALDDYFGFFKTPMWRSPLKDTSVWSDGKWVIKKVSSPNEQLAMKSLLGVPGIVQLGGLFEVTTGEHKGSTLLFTRYTGKPVTVDVDDLDSDHHVREAVRDALRAVHKKGWHHHDIHPGNVLIDDQQRITLIDFGSAVRAQDCLDPQLCPDSPYVFDEDEGSEDA